jgi:hypothetical protein
MGYRVDAAGNLIKVEDKYAGSRQRTGPNRGSLASLSSGTNEGPRSGNQQYTWRGGASPPSSGGGAAGGVSGRPGWRHAATGRPQAGGARTGAVQQRGPLDTLAAIVGLEGRTVNVPGLERPVPAIYPAVIAVIACVFGWRPGAAALLLCALYLHNEHVQMGRQGGEAR